MAVGRLKIRNLNLILVFRHKWERHGDALKDFKQYSMFRKWELGFWFEKTRMLGVKGFMKPNHHMVGMYILGINLLICKAWVEWDINGLHLGE